MEISVRSVSTEAVQIPDAYGSGLTEVHVTIRGTTTSNDIHTVNFGKCSLVPSDRMKALEHLAERCALIREIVPFEHPLRGWIDDCLEKLDA